MSVSYPLVTVLMSCYNASRWLAESVNSILNQTFEDFEFVIVDDGSVDDTARLLQDFKAHDDRIIIVTKKNTGLADSLNMGMHAAQGEWIARLDADDIAEPTRLAQQITVARLRESLVFVGSGLSVINEAGMILGQYNYPSRHISLLKNLRTARKFPPHSSAMYRKVAAEALGGYRLRMKRAQDLDLWLRLSEVGELACVQEPLVRIRKHPQQISYDEGGRRQLLDCRMGLTSYWIRSCGGADPINRDETEYKIFREWLIAQLTHAGFFDVQELKIRLKNAITGFPKNPSYFFRELFSLLSRPRGFVALFKEWMFGELLTRQIAGKWMK